MLPSNNHMEPGGLVLLGEDTGRALPFRSSPAVGLGQEGGDAEGALRV